MSYLPHEIIVERTPARELARRLVEVLFEAGVAASMSARAGLEIRRDGSAVSAASWDIRVADSEASRACTALALARRYRLLGGASANGSRSGLRFSRKSRLSVPLLT